MPPLRAAEQLPQSHHDQETAEAAVEQLYIQAGGGPGGQSGASQPGQDGGPDGLTVDIAIFDVGGQGGGGSGEKVEQVDALGQILGHPAKAVI